MADRIADLINPEQVARVLKDCALKYILPRFQNLQSADIQTKTHANDFVTIADIEAEAALSEILPKMYPGTILIGEEGVSSGVVNTDILGEPGHVVFVADPVDGTGNFKNGKNEFAIMMALVVNGKTRMGWIYDVVNDTQYITQKGKGTTRNGEPVQVRPALDISDPAVQGHMEYRYFPKKVHPYLKEQGAEKFKSLHCAAHEYLRIASGQSDFAVFSHMKPWDHLAGVLMVEEAGGIVRKFDGSPYVVTDEKGGIIVASSTAIMEQVRDRFIIPAKGLAQPKPGKS